MLKMRSLSNSNRKEYDMEMEMNQRIEAAKGWVSYKLSNEEAETINKNLGIEQDLLEAMEQGKKVRQKQNQKKNSIGKIRGIEVDKESPVMIRGFLQQNPVLCSGCGTPFQSKSPDSPGS